MLTLIQYESPWERAWAWLMALDRTTGEIMFEVPDGTWRSRLADACDRCDAKWRLKWAARYPRKPRDIWKRRTGKDTA